MSEMPLWERRFRAPKMTLPHWSRSAPDRTVFASNESGVWQVHNWNVATGERRKVSDHPVGVTQGYASLDGAEVLFWQEDTGDETGRWLTQAFEGGGSEPLFEGLPVGWNDGVALGPGIAAVAIADRDGGFAVFVSIDGGQAKEVARSTEWIGIAGNWDDVGDRAGLSANGALLALQHPEHGDVLRHAYDARHELFRYDIASASHARVETPPGSITDARVRPDGSVWYRHTDGVHRARILDDHGEEPIAVLGEAAPPGRPFLDWRYTNDRGQQVHGWVVEPEGEGPHPVMVFVHGGPHWLYEDAYMPEVQAYVDAGFLVAMPNYRGSSGYGRAWSDALTGDVGFTDVDDVTAGLQDVLRRPDVDPSRTVVAGWSWGGYITLMELGRYPGLWSAGMAGVPVGDYLRAYDEEAPSLQALDRALMGGTPETEPDAFRRSSPLTYADQVAAPVLLVIGENDSRCPVGQALAYAHRLKERGKPHEVYLYTTGHGALATDEDVRQQQVVLEFLRSVVPGLRTI